MTQVTAVDRDKTVKNETRYGLLQGKIWCRLKKYYENSRFNVMYTMDIQLVRKAGPNFRKML